MCYNGTMYSMALLILRIGTFSLAALLPRGGSANCPEHIVCVDTGVYSTIQMIFSGLINIMIVWGPILAAVIFICGAFWMVASGGEETRLASGKKMMKGAAIGLAIVLASWLILNTIATFLFASL